MAIIHISRPVLTPGERARRMDAIKKATLDLVIAREKEGKKNAR